MPALTRKRDWLGPMALLAVIALGLFGGLFALDNLLDDGGAANPVTRYVDFDDDVVSESIGEISTTIAAILGIIVTVVSIIVQLTATRYTPAVTEMFFRDRTNQIAMSIYVIGGVKAMWIAWSLEDGWVPKLSLFGMLGVGTIGFVMMAPYFAYVFRFLAPESLVARIQNDARREARAAADTFDVRAIAGYQKRFLTRTEQLTDVAVNAVTNKDRIIATHCVDALRDLTLAYFDHRPATGSPWYRLTPQLAAHPDFASMAEGSLEAIERHETWFEFKILRQYQALYTEALGTMRDINYIVAINTCAIARRALELDSRESLELAIKFFNTYLRATLNQGDVRTAYTILNQYRMLAESALAADDGETALKIARHIKFYGRLSYDKKIPFVTETAGYDLGALCEAAHDLGVPEETGILDVFLEVDPAVTEGEIQEASLRGVRKAQLKLATYYLKADAARLARRIWEDMLEDRPERLASIRDELLAVESEDFWEISDRGGNFDYLDPDRKAMLPIFYGWFAEAPGDLRALAASQGGAGGGATSGGDGD